jgi:hypothetical protein
MKDLMRQFEMTEIHGGPQVTGHNDNCSIVHIVRYNTGIWMLRVELDNLGAYTEKFAYNILQFIRPWRQDRASKPTRCPALRLLLASRNAYSPRLNARIKEIWLFLPAQPEPQITLGVYKKYYDFNSKKIFAIEPTRFFNI